MLNFLKNIYLNYIVLFLNTFFESIIIITQKLASVVFLLCLIVIIAFCIDLGYAIYRTMIYFFENKTLEISSMIMDSKIIITCISVYGAKSLMRKFVDMKNNKDS